MATTRNKSSHGNASVTSRVNARAKATNGAGRGVKADGLGPKVLSAQNAEKMFQRAAETFRVMSAPMRLRIINSLCQSEKNVGQLLEEIPTTQPNMSQHLNTLYKAKILGRRREGVQIYYRIINDQVVSMCRAMCNHITAMPEGD